MDFLRCGRRSSTAVFVFIALSIIHGMLWHKGDMTAVPGEAKVMETLRGLNVQPGDYRFPHANSVDEMKTPEFAEKMKQGPVGIMSIWPSGGINMGKLLGQWFVYSLFIGAMAAPARTRAKRRHAVCGLVTSTFRTCTSTRSK